jgi:type IV secretion system protein VirB10
MDSQFHTEETMGALPPPRKSGVRRVNNMPLFIAGGVLVVFMALVAIVAYERATDAAKGKGNEAALVDEGLADQVLRASGGREGGLVGAEDSPSLPIAPVTDMDLPPPPPEKEDPFAAQLRAAKMALLQKAIMAKTPVSAQADMSTNKAPPENGSNPESAHASVAARRGQSLTDSIDEQIADLLRNTAGKEQGGTAQNDGSGPRRDNRAYAQFDQPGRVDRWRLDSSVEAPRTLYELRAGFVIPATLISGINSDLPGQIIAQVSQDVFDSATGRYRLIPQGTRLVGTYDAQVAYGQRRLLVAWQRLIFPDGKAMDIGSMPGADSAGYAGFNDKTNNHYLRIFGNALLMSGVIAGINSSQTNPDNDPFGTSTNTLITQALAQQMGRVATEMIQKNLNISPTLEIRPGYRFNVMAVKDLTFQKPYQPFDY